MAVRFRLPSDSLLDDSADPLSGGTLSFYVTGTTTPLSTYSDNGLTTANANPLTLDAAGRHGDIFLLPQIYKVLLKNSAGATVKTMDPVAGTPVVAFSWEGAFQGFKTASELAALTPAVGDRYILTNGTYEDQGAEYRSYGWEYSGAPATYQEARVSGALYRYISGTWTAVAEAGRVSWATPVKRRITATEFAALSPSAGDRYLLTTGANANQVAEYFAAGTDISGAAGWDYSSAPKVHQPLHVTDEGTRYLYSGTEFVSGSLLNALRWKKATAGVRARSRNALHLCIGNSLTAGAGSNGLASGVYTNSYPFVAAERLTRELGIPAMAESMCGDLNMVDAGLDIGAHDPRRTLGAGWSYSSSKSLGGRILSNSTTVNDFVFAPTYDTYFTLADTAYILSVGGTTAQGYGELEAELEYSGGVEADSVETFDLGDYGTRGVYLNKIKSATARQYWVNCRMSAASQGAGNLAVNVICIILMNSATKQVVVVNAGWCGGTAADFIGDTNSANAAYYFTPLKAALALSAGLVADGVDTFLPAQAEFEFGANEMLATSPTIPATTLGTSLETILTATEDYMASLLRVPNWIDPNRLPAASQTPYHREIKEAGWTMGVPVRSLADEFVSFAAADAEGLMDDDVHGNGFFYAIDGAKSADDIANGPE